MRCFKKDPRLMMMRSSAYPLAYPNILQPESPSLLRGSSTTIQELIGELTSFCWQSEFTLCTIRYINSNDEFLCAEGLFMSMKVPPSDANVVPMKFSPSVVFKFYLFNYESKCLDSFIISFVSCTICIFRKYILNK